jgi:tungstate transport system substrate-binding protein
MLLWLGLGFCLALALTGTAQANDPFITVASTTSTKNSGLFDHLLPRFEDETGSAVRVLAVGTGQAIRLARNGDADVLLVHHKPSEQQFIGDGYGVARFDVMYNDFVLVGPADDPARIGGMTDAPAALARLAAAEVPFVSRGDDSGTHKRELALWRAARVELGAVSGSWYREAGAGMGATLNTAAAMGAYALADRGTWLGFRNKADLMILVAGDERLFNPYGVILVNPAKHPHIKAALGQRFIDWLVSLQGQAVIAEFKINGEPAFTPNAAPPELD